MLKFPKAIDIATQVASSANISSLVGHLENIKTETEDAIQRSKPSQPIFTVPAPPRPADAPSAPSAPSAPLPPQKPSESHQEGEKENHPVILPVPLETASPVKQMILKDTSNDTIKQSPVKSSPKKPSPVVQPRKSSTSSIIHFPK